MKYVKGKSRGAENICDLQPPITLTLEIKSHQEIKSAANKLYISFQEHEL